MNWKNAFFVAVVAFAATLAWAVRLNSKLATLNAPESELSTDKQTKSGIHSNHTLSTQYGCTQENETQSNYGMINQDTANCRISAYEYYKIQLENLIRTHGFNLPMTLPYGCELAYPVPHLPTNTHILLGDQQVITGFKIESPCEFKTMINNAVSSNANDVYVYLALQPRVNGNGVYDVQGGGNPPVAYLMLDLIFRVKSDQVNDSHGNPIPRDNSGHYYYDFTTPCPPMCDPDPLPSPI